MQARELTALYLESVGHAKRRKAYKQGRQSARVHTTCRE